MAEHALNWIGNNIIPWVLLVMMVLAAALVILGIVCAVWSFFSDEEEPQQIVLNQNEWTCTNWHVEEEFVPPVLIGGMIYPQPKRQVTVADVYVRNGFKG